jgi:hypothetical protein
MSKKGDAEELVIETEDDDFDPDALTEGLYSTGPD